MKKKIPFIAILVFYVIAIFIRFLTNKTTFLTHFNNDFKQVIFPVTALGPAIGAVVAAKLFGIKMPLTLKGNFKNIFIPFSLYWLFPVLLISIQNYCITGAFTFHFVFAILVYGLLEEIGWRGFLQQTLQPLPVFTQAFVVSVLWYVWHLSFEINMNHLIFFGILFIGSWGIGLVANKTNSLLAVAAFHSLNNFPKISTYNFIIGGLLIFVWVLSIVYFNKLALKKSIDSTKLEGII